MSDARAREADRLHVFFTCHAFVCAMPARAVVRLVLPDDVEAQPVAAACDEASVVRAGAELYAASDLARIFAVPALPRALLLLRIPRADDEIPMALRIGPCLFVGELGAVTRVPGSLFRARPGAISGAFLPAAWRGRGAAAAMGLVLDPRRLFTSAELDAARAVLDHAEGDAARRGGGRPS